MLMYDDSFGLYEDLSWFMRIRDDLFRLMLIYDDLWFMRIYYDLGRLKMAKYYQLYRIWHILVRRKRLRADNLCTRSYMHHDAF